MKSPLLKPILQGALALLTLLGLTSCIEESTVIKISKDGSGVIHTRKYENDQAGKGLLGGLGGGGNADGGGQEEIDAPTEEEFEAKAKTMGDGVTFKTVRMGKNASGWTGYEAIYAFKDINKVKLDLNMKDADDMKPPEEGQEALENEDAEVPQVVMFEMQDGLLKIKTPDLADQAEDSDEGNGEANDPDGGAQDPFAGDADNPQMMAMMAAMFAGAKIGFFVEIDGEIAETNAKHEKGNMITIMRADLGKLLADPEAMKKAEALENESREDAQKVVDSIEGMDIDLQDPIRVKFK